MKTLIAAVAFAAMLGAPAFAQSTSGWAWKGASAAPASATSAYAFAPFAGRRDARSARRGDLSVRRVVLARRNYARECNVSPASPFYRTNCN
jgi:membrane protein implicated in regulation of membrane protease activity